MLLWVLFSIAGLIQATPLQVVPRDTNPEDYRLPENQIETLTYKLDLTLKDDISVATEFTGSVVITFKAIAETDQIHIHASAGIKIETGTLTPSDGLNTTEYNSDPDTEIMVLQTNEPLTPNTIYELTFHYTAELITEDMYGLYKSSYKNEDGETEYLATTQFESTYARRAFPCFDEPSYKAEFSISIKHPSDYNVRSNTLYIENSTLVDDEDNMRLTSFEKTPKTPTYLVAFIISKFSCTANENTNDVPYEVCSRIGTESTRTLAVEKSPLLMQALEDMTGVKYDISNIGKMDQYAIPDFAAGAMENWGLVTYRETGLLYDPNESSNSYKQSIENVISHEFAHQWFGNLVTMHWWKDTWLNEGFARYYQYFATAEVEKSWELEKQFVVAQVQPVFVADSSASVKALSADAYTQVDISNRFFTISYAKGASVIRMMINFLGQEVYKTGINKYLADNQFTNTKPEDLWDAFEADIATLPGESLATVMGPWIEKPGFPVLQVNLDGDNIVISQKRFLATTEVPEDTKWFVPITYTTSTNPNNFENTAVQDWLLPTENLTLRLNLSDSWIILNNKQIGYYRVNYDDVLWKRIISALNTDDFEGIHEINRAQIVDDFYNLAKSTVQSHGELLDLLQYLKNETGYAPWYAAFTAFNNMLSRTGSTQMREYLSEYILELLKPSYERLGFEESKDDEHVNSLHRALAASWACKLGLKACEDSAVAAFQAYKIDGTPADRNLRSVIYCNGLRHSADIVNDWAFLWKKFTEAKLTTEVATIMTALGCAKDPEILKAYLKTTIGNDATIRQQDATTVFSSVYSGNFEGIDVALEFFLENYEDIDKQYKSMSALNTVLSGIASRLTNQDQLTKLEDFLKTDGLSEEMIKAGESAIGSAKANVAMVEAFEKELALYFIRENPTDPPPSSATRLTFSTIIVLVLGIVFYTQ